MKNLIFTISLFLSTSYLQAQRTLVPQKEETKVHFVIKNFGIKTSGDFSGLKGKILFDPVNIALWLFDVTIDASTIDTDNSTRDGHLRKPDYFDVGKYPVIRMVSTRVTTITTGVYHFTGNLTVKGITKPLQFSFKVKGTNGGYLFTGDFPLNRRDFDIGGSSVSLADSLKVSLNVFAK